MATKYCYQWADKRLRLYIVVVPFNMLTVTEPIVLVQISAPDLK